MSLIHTYKKSNQINSSYCIHNYHRIIKLWEGDTLPGEYITLVVFESLWLSAAGVPHVDVPAGNNRGSRQPGARKLYQNTKCLHLCKHVRGRKIQKTKH